MTLDQLRYFVTVVEEGTISGAARRLHLSQPPLSLQIRNLEAETGSRLFERGARQIRLTEAGSLLYAHAARILEMTESAEMDMQSFRAGTQQSLHLGVISSGTCPEFMDGVRRFHSLHPEVAFHIYDDNTYALLTALDRQKIELAVIRTPFLERGLQIVPLRSDPMVAAGRKEMLPVSPLTLSFLAEKPLIIYRRWEKILRECFAREKLTPSILCINDDARTSLQWAMTGIGLALVPASICDVVTDLSYAPIATENLISQICLVRRTDRPLSPGAEAFFSLFAS